MRFESNILSLLPFFLAMALTVSAADEATLTAAPPANTNAAGAGAQWPINAQEGCDLEQVKSLYSSFSAKLGGAGQSTSVVEGYLTEGAPQPTDACEDVPLRFKRGPHHENAVTFTLPGNF